jgi:hypothetical protein
VLPVLIATLLALPAPTYAVRCLDDPSDPVQIGAARATIDAACDCFSFEKYNLYQRCVTLTLNAEVAANNLRRECRGTVKRIYGRSVCGRPVGRNGPFVPCVSTTQTGRVACLVKPTRLCEPTPAKAIARCHGFTTCLDAADTNGDLLIAAPGDTGACTPSSYTDNGDGTITDDNLGLTWEKLSYDGSIHQFTDTHEFAEAQAKVATLNATTFAGHDDWRLPSVRELHTLLRPGPAPLIDPIFNTGCTFPCPVTTCSCTSTSSVFDEETWSSTLYPFHPNSFWTVDFRSLGADAGVASGIAGNDDNHVRAVRP